MAIENYVLEKNGFSAVFHNLSSVVDSFSNDLVMKGLICQDLLSEEVSVSAMNNYLKAWESSPIISLEEFNANFENLNDLFNPAP